MSCFARRVVSFRESKETGIRSSCQIPVGVKIRTARCYEPSRERGGRRVSEKPRKVQTPKAPEEAFKNTILSTTPTVLVALTGLRSVCSKRERCTPGTRLTAYRYRAVSGRDRVSGERLFAHKVSTYSRKSWNRLHIVNLLYEFSNAPSFRSDFKCTLLAVFQKKVPRFLNYRNV